MSSSVTTSGLVGRKRELQALAEALLSALAIRDPTGVCAVHGVSGAGKSALVARFAAMHESAFPGGDIPLPLLREDRPDDRALFARLAKGWRTC